MSSRVSPADPGAEASVSVTGPHDGDVADVLARAARHAPLHVLGYHAPGHLGLLETLYGGQGWTLLVRMAGQPVAVMPGLWAEVAGLGAVYNSLPHYGPNGGLVFAEDLLEAPRAAAWRACLEAVEEEAARRDAAAWSVLTPVGVEWGSGWAREGLPLLVERRVTHVQPLAACLRWRDRLRADLARAERCGITVKRDPGRSELAALLAIYEANCAEHGIPPKDRRFLAPLADHVQQGHWCRAAVAVRDGAVVGGLIVVASRSTVSYHLPAFRSDTRPTQGSAALLDDAFRWGLETGRTWWNWEASPPGRPGVADFKRRWGGQAAPYARVTRLRRLDRILALGPARIAQAFPRGYVAPFALLGPPGGGP